MPAPSGKPREEQPEPPLVLALTPDGSLLLEAATPGDAGLDALVAKRLRAPLALGAGHLLLHLALDEVGTTLPAGVEFFRGVASLFVARLCKLKDLETERERADVPVPGGELLALAGAVPPFRGAEYVDAELLTGLWQQMLEAFRRELEASKDSVQEFLRQRSAVWHLVGRVHFHLAERKDDPQRPFAFLATYTTSVGTGKRIQHRALGKAVADSAEARDKAALLALLEPVQRAADRNEFVAELLESGAVFRPVAWTPKDAHRFLNAILDCEAAGIVTLVPDWWKARRPPRPQVQVRLGDSAPSQLGLAALVDFDVRVTLGDVELDATELAKLLAQRDGLVRVRGQWVELDREKLEATLAHWKRVEHQVGRHGLSFAESMRLLAGAPLERDTAPQSEPTRESWSEIHAGAWLTRTLAALREPVADPERPDPELLATLRPYQRVGVAWLARVAKLGLGACLADDMGLGKTIQVIALLLQLRRESKPAPSLLLAPASLVANWQAELERFAPSLLTFVAHPSATPAAELADLDPAALAELDLVITTYGTALRLSWLADVEWNLVVLDEAQAIKNPGAKQTRATKALRARSRIALTGTPIENRLGDLWSLFDFLNPGLLGSALEFARFCKRLERHEPPDFGPLRRLVGPYVLRRMKSDKRVIQDLPDKSEVAAFCNLSRKQAVLYQEAVDELRHQLETLSGIQRKGTVLAFLLRMKQICNHPSQWLGDQEYAADASGKFGRLAEICEAIAARRQKVLVFTQFREITEPLAAFLATVFARPGLVLHGDTSLPERKKRVARFQEDPALPFFVLSVKAGGTGLNLTAASHVIHFDRWWNPAVEYQATDRA